jgi:hypothetical protein
VALTQLRGMLAAVQSTEVAEEHQYHGFATPEVAEPVGRTGVIGERRVGECGEIHGTEPNRVGEFA